MNFKLFVEKFNITEICKNQSDAILQEIMKDEKLLSFTITKIYSLFKNNEIIEGFKIMQKFLE